MRTSGAERRSDRGRKTMPLLVNSGLEVVVVNTLSESWLQKLRTQTSREAGSARADGSLQSEARIGGTLC